MDEKEQQFSQLEDQREKLNEIITEFQDKSVLMDQEIENKERTIFEQKNELEEQRNHVKLLLINEKEQTQEWLSKYRIESDENSRLSQKIIKFEDDFKNEVFLRNNLINKLEEAER